ncbi:MULTISPECIES: hypothetical protein [unclassified Enterococcus]|uniref:hypothetical protein n=1 Tax=unclassified Enterococcus TaxID=2608891 RepID=UPI0013ECAA45|nr:MULTISPECIES: hypothetical protein [unclassified Enterococcus]
MNKETERLKKEILAAGNSYVRQRRIEPLSVESFMAFQINGDRLAYETAYFARRKQLAAVALTYVYEKKQETKEWLEQLIWEICNEYTWALPAHLPNRTGLTEEDRRYIDLFAAETGQALAEITELVGDHLLPEITQRVRMEIERRLFFPFEQKKWAWEYKENNWSAVIGGCIGMACLSMLPVSSERSVKMIERLDQAMSSYLRGFKEDGACVEGVGYWGYGFGYYIYYAKKLADKTGDRRYLEKKKVREVARFPYYAQFNDSYLPFSDFSHAHLPSGLLSFCATAFSVPYAILHASRFDFDHCYRFAHLYRNLKWTVPADSKLDQTNIRHYFSDAQWLIVHSFDHQLMFATKGGDNLESHNHLDVGHFVFGNLTTLFLTDLGAGEYTKAYFDEQSRYDFFVTSASGHSLPIVNRSCQLPNGQSASSLFADAETGKAGYDLTGTYGENAQLDRFHRCFFVDESNRSVRIQDQFSFTQKKNEIIENFITRIKPTVQQENIRLTDGGEMCEIQFEKKGLKHVQIIERYFRDHHGDRQTAYQIQATYHVSKQAEISIDFKLMDKG